MDNEQNHSQSDNTNSAKLSSDMSAKSSSRASKKAILAVLAVAVLAGVAVGVGHLQKKQAEQQKAKTVSTTGAKKEIDNTTEEEKVLRAQAENYQAQIDKLPGSAPAEDKVDLYLKLAGAQYRLGQYDNALKSLNTIKGDNPTNHRMWTLYTNIYWDKADFAEARAASERALDIDRENPQSWLAFIELQEDQSKENLDKRYNDAIDRTDSAIEVVVAYAKFLEKQGDKPGAVAQWQKAAEILPTKKAEYDAEIARLQQP